MDSTWRFMDCWISRIGEEKFFCLFFWPEELDENATELRNRALRQCQYEDRRAQKDHFRSGCFAVEASVGRSA